MNRRVHLAAAIATGVIPAAVASALWLGLPTDLRDYRLLSLRNGILLLLIGAVIAVSFFGAIYLVLQRRFPVSIRTAGIAALVSSVLIGMWLQRFTDMGVFVGGGADFWVSRAASASSEGDSLSYLRVAYGATQYGIHSARKATRQYPASTRVRLLRQLSTLPANDFLVRELLEEAAQLESQAIH